MSQDISTTRRSFLIAMAGGAIGAAWALSRPGDGETGTRLGRVGLQLYTVREPLAADFSGTLAAVAAAGYAEVELAGLLGHSARDFRAELDRNRLAAPSSHVPIESLRDSMSRLLDEAGVLGHRYLVCPDIPSEDRTADGYARAADVLNRAGEAARSVGVTVGYHNHDFELAATGGTRPYDLLLQRTDPALVTMEMDIYWMLKGGADPVAYFDAHPGRFTMVHVKDMDATQRRGMTDVGSGTVDWKRVLAHARKAGVEHWFVEHDEAARPLDSMRASYRYLSQLDIPAA